MNHCYRAGGGYGVNLQHVTSWEVGEVEVEDGDGAKVKDMDLAISLAGGGQLHILRSQFPAEHDALHRVLMNEYVPLTPDVRTRPTRVK